MLALRIIMSSVCPSVAL